MKAEKKRSMELVTVRVPPSMLEEYERSCIDEMLTMSKSKYFRLMLEHSKKTNFTLLTQG
jgi:hypothetical protein